VDQPVFTPLLARLSLSLFGLLFGSCRVAATIHNRDGVGNQEQGGHVDVCTDPVRSWGALWPWLRHYG
jgi:hypothetical protein